MELCRIALCCDPVSLEIHLTLVFYLINENPKASMNSHIVRAGIVLMCGVMIVSCNRSDIKPVSDSTPTERLLRFDEVTWLCTHNSYNASESGFRFPNQTHPIKKQLEDGVRALMLDVWLQDDKVVLRHGDIAKNLLGSKPLLEELKAIHEFLVANSDAIVTLIFESYVSPERIEQVFKEAGLIEFCHTQDTRKPWPTLRWMRDNNRRLVVFSDRAQDAPDWYMPIWDHCFETHWDVSSPEGLLKNPPGRGRNTNSLLVANHFVNGLFKRQNARKVSSPGFLNKRFGDEGKLDRKPNFIAVDFYEKGDILGFVEKLNKKADLADN